MRPEAAAPPPCAFAEMPALRCGACAAAPCARQHHAALDAAAAALPVVGRDRAPRAHGWRARPDRRAVRGGPGPPGAAARSARRWAHNTELAALPAAADWPSLKIL